MAFISRLVRAAFQRHSSLVFHGNCSSSLYTKWRPTRGYQKDLNLRFLSHSQVVPSSEELDKIRRTVFFGGLESAITEDNVKDYFAGFGEVESVSMIKTFLGFSRNFGFACFKETKVVDEVLAQKHVIQDINIDVRKCNKFRVIYVGGLPTHFTEKHIEDHFSMFGDIESVKFISKFNAKSGFAFVTFSSMDEAFKALAGGDQEIRGYSITVKSRYSSDAVIEAEVSASRKLKVNGLPFETTVEQLRDHFENFGCLKSIDLLVNSETSTCAGIVIFDTLEGTTNASTTENHAIEGVPVQVVRIPDSFKILVREKSIFLENLSPQTTKTTIINYFRTYGQIAKVYLSFDTVSGLSQGFGVVKFRAPKTLEQFENISTHHIDGQYVKVRRRGLKLRSKLAINEISGLNLGLSAVSYDKKK